jgi:hypothetical protein
MPDSGNTHGDDDDDGPANPIDRWEGLLEQIASDVARIRGVVVMAWWCAWFALVVLSVGSIIFHYD